MQIYPPETFQLIELFPFQIYVDTINPELSYKMWMGLAAQSYLRKLMGEQTVVLQSSGIPDIVTLYPRAWSSTNLFYPSRPFMYVR